MPGSLEAVFWPRSVAVIGASRDPRSMSGSLLQNLRSSFRGPLWAVNPRALQIGGIIGGVPAFESILDIPEPVDLAFLAMPAAHVLEVARQCIQKHVRAMVVITAGFSETGQAGRDLQQRLLELTREARIPLVGPNCLGVLNTDKSGPLNGTFSLPTPPTGTVAIGTQSGALGFVFPDFIRQWNLGISQLLSTGNKGDIGENELLEYWHDDPHTRLIQLYLESFQDPRRFLQVARVVARDKPVVVLKAGRTEAGKRAAGSHTAALAGPEAAVDALLRQAGVVRVTSLQQLFEVTALLATQPLPTGPRVAILTNAGGPGVLCTDALEAGGLQVPECSTRLQAQLRAGLPVEASVRNPIDLIGSTDPGHFRHCLGILLRSDEVDVVVVIYVPRLPHTSAGIARVVADATATDPPKTLLAVFMQSEGPPDELQTGTRPVPSFRYPEAAARALLGADQRRQWLARPSGQMLRPTGMRLDLARQVVLEALDQLPSDGGWLGAEATQHLLAACGFSLPPWRVVEPAGDVVRAAREIGDPVVLKALSPTVVHKSAAGGVAVDLRTDDELRQAQQRILAAVPDASHLLVQQFVAGGLELMLGVRRDPAFGHLIGCGLGGVFVERLGRIRFRLHPLTDQDALDLLADSLGPTNADHSIRDALLRISGLISAVPEISEMDLNPTKVFDGGQRYCCLDARCFVSLPLGNAHVRSNFELDQRP